MFPQDVCVSVNNPNQMSMSCVPDITTTVPSKLLHWAKYYIVSYFMPLMPAVRKIARYSLLEWDFVVMRKVCFIHVLGKTLLSLCHSAFNGCPYGPDSRWNITWANTPRNTVDTQRCPGGVETRGNIHRGCEQCEVLQNHAQSGDSFSHCEFWNYHVFAGNATRLCMSPHI